jgi:prepilin-type N-terminal cleavage/methylation domain-containing protein
MMNNPIRSNCFSIKGGFTLLEVMVTLALGALILGGLMGLISVSLQYNQRLKAKSQIQPLLESAAQEILADPKKAMARSIPMGSEPNAPRVNIQLARVELPEPKGTAIRTGELYRVLLECRGQVLEFSLYITRSDIEGADGFSG